MKTLGCDLQTTSPARAVATPPPIILSQKLHPWPAVHTLRWLLIYSELCNHHHYLIPKYFLCPQRNLQSLAVSPHCRSPSHPSMASINLLFMCMDLCYPGPILYLESSRTVESGFLHLALCPRLMLYHMRASFLFIAEQCCSLCQWPWFITEVTSLSLSEVRTQSGKQLEN